MPRDGDSIPDPAERSRYELMRAKHVTVPVSIPRKLRWCGGLALLAALTAPIVATLPEAVRAGYFAGNPTTTPLGAATVALFGVGCVAAAVLGLAVLQRHLVRNPDPDESRVWTLIGTEDALSGIAFITGALGVLLGVGILVTGHWGVDRVEWLIDSGIDPYLVFTSVPVTPRLTSVVSLVVAIGAFAASVYLDQ